MSCTIDEKGKWHRGEMPDDALPKDSLVARIINADAVRPKLLAEAMEFLDEYDSDFKALAAAERSELPLWRVMEEAVIDAPWNGRELRAMQVEAVQNWLFPQGEPKPWDDRLEIYTQLTEQARIAREGT